MKRLNRVIQLFSKIFCLSILFGFSAMGAIQKVTVSGVASNIAETEATSTSPASHTIYGGYNGDSACKSEDRTGTGTCNSCKSSTQLVPCNETMVYPGSKVRITFQTNSTNLTTPLIVVNVGTSQLTAGTHYTASQGAIAPNQDLFIELDWDQICKAILGLSACAPDTTTPLHESAQITFGIDTDNNSQSITEAATVTFDFTYIPQDPLLATAQLCPPDQAYSSGNHGACFYRMFPGDEKAYVVDVKYDVGFPTTSIGSSINALAFFYVPAATTVSPGVFASMTSSLDNLKIKLSNIDTASLSANFDRSFIEGGFVNGQPYCFMMANVDLSGNIFNFMDPSTLEAQSSDYCVTPQEVVGLLDQKECFVATAAFGSQMASEVITFKAFRDQILKKSNLGNFLVKAYYKFSPPVARAISKSEILRTISRGILWPFLWLAQASLKYGLFFSMVFVLLFLLGALYLGYYLKMLRTFNEKK